ncbi:MAG: alkaline phosphatase family protein [Gammaproteobacteria bacterium]|nr:alkaline phosphatase family protein [Gammaproteobacteria bacterium]
MQLTVDGLRADLLTRYADRFGNGGFRYLLDHGTVYTNAHYQHANTETIVGHATLATGAQPSTHGMTGNVWYDADAGELSYNIEDPNHPILPSRAETKTGEQVDPSQRLARTQGRSPAALLTETFSDKLFIHTAGRAKVFGISGKDRSAVAMAGHMGKALWYSTNSGDFVTSTYYYDDYPAWVQRWNDLRKAESYAGQYWELLLDDPVDYLLGQQDDRPFETDLKGYGRTFPHQFGTTDGGLLPTQIMASPVGDRLLADFARRLIENEHLGEDEVPDYLSVSFSSIDAVNHFFGPSSLENEDAMLQLDRTLAELFSFIDKRIGLNNVIIVLSADHGMAEIPEYVNELGYANAGRLYSDTVVDAANRIGQSEFDYLEVVRFYYRPYLYLDNQKIAESGGSPSVVRNALALALTKEAGITLATTAEGLVTLPDSKLLRQIRNTYHPQRSGDIYVVQAPYWFNFDRGPVAAMHGSPWSYDTHVPVIFAGGRIPAQKLHRLIQPADVAPTLAALLGMTPPASAEGRTLLEVMVQPRMSLQTQAVPPG